MLKVASSTFSLLSCSANKNMLFMTLWQLMQLTNGHHRHFAEPRTCLYCIHAHGHLYLSWTSANWPYSAWSVRSFENFEVFTEHKYEFVSVSELTLGLRATPFKISSSTLCSGPSIKVQSEFGDRHPKIEVPQNPVRSGKTCIKTPPRSVQLTFNFLKMNQQKK